MHIAYRPPMAKSPVHFAGRGLTQTDQEIDAFLTRLDQKFAPVATVDRHSTESTFFNVADQRYLLYVSKKWDSHWISLGPAGLENPATKTEIRIKWQHYPSKTEVAIHENGNDQPKMVSTHRQVYEHAMRLVNRLERLPSAKPLDM